MTSGDFSSRAPRHLIRPTDPPQPNGFDPFFGAWGCNPIHEMNRSSWLVMLRRLTGQSV
ncbi:unnamed protein product, partial [Ectocarpus sp. 12 AP-2014]